MIFYWFRCMDTNLVVQIPRGLVCCSLDQQVNLVKPPSKTTDHTLEEVLLCFDVLMNLSVCKRISSGVVRLMTTCRITPVIPLLVLTSPVMRVLKTNTVWFVITDKAIGLFRGKPFIILSSQVVSRGIDAPRPTSVPCLLRPCHK
jgi:hypothetical protein